MGVFSASTSASKLLHVGLPGDAREMLQDERGNAAAAIVAVGHKGDLGSVFTLSGVASSADQNFAVCSLRRDDESNDLAEVDVGQLIEFAVAQLFLGTEEAPVDRLAVEALECLQQAALVLSANGPNGDGSAILQDFVGGVVARIHSVQSMM